MSLIKKQFLTVLTLLITMSLSTQAKLKIAIIPKTKNLSFFEDSHRGCLDTAKVHKEIECIYDGPIDFQDPRQQAIVLNNLLKQDLDAILLAVTDSDFLVENGLKQAREKGIPIITYDSDLKKEHHKYRLAYVGTDNIALGKALGDAAKKYKRNEVQNICIQSGSEGSPNLEDRIRGVRLSLTEGKSSSKMDGKYGWKEIRRCPLYTFGKAELAVFQVDFILNKKEDLVFLPIAGFAQFSPNYIPKIKPHLENIKSNLITIISADTLDIQLKALAEGLSTENIGQNPYEMGRRGTKMLYEYLTKKKLPKKEFNYVSFHHCTQDNVDTCVK
jgi:ribose transport system substrate-binding protein